MKGYKAFNKGWICRDFQYEIGQIYELPDGQEPIMCERGFHFCKNPVDVFGYYPISEETLIAEVEALGSIIQEGTKFCTNKIRIVKEFTRKQLQALFLDGKLNSGKPNSGDLNSGRYNSGNYNSGDYNSGEFNSGECNSGHYNTGDSNSGSRNCGDRNTGHRNSGDLNAGRCNSGDCNSGSYNSGNHNSGSFNSGDFNSGSYNSGNYNRGDHNSGIFNSKDPKMWAFDKPSTVTYKQFIASLDYSFSHLCERIAYKNLTAEDWDRIRALPNYDAEIFAEITGLREGEST